MSVKTRTILNGKIAIIELKGGVIGDSVTDEFRAAVVDFLEQGIKCLVINLQKVNYMNSSGIGALISAHASYSKNGGAVKLIGISNNIQNLLAITKLIDVFDVYDTLDEAVKDFSKINNDN